MPQLLPLSSVQFHINVSKQLLPIQGDADLPQACFFKRDASPITEWFSNFKGTLHPKLLFAGEGQGQ